MKNALLLFALFVGISAFGQEENTWRNLSQLSTMMGCVTGETTELTARPLNNNLFPLKPIYIVESASQKLIFICGTYSNMVYCNDGVQQPEEREARDSNVRICHGEIVSVYFIDGAPIKPSVHSEGIMQPTETNELPNGTMPLSKDLPYVHTLRGYTYTADYLRYTPRY